MVVNLYYTAPSDIPISQITPTCSLWLHMVVNFYYTATSDLPISQITLTSSLCLQDGGESLLHCNIRLTHFTYNTNMFTVTTGWWWISTTLQHQTYPFQIIPTSSLWLQDGGKSLLYCNIRLTHFTDNTIFIVTTGWWLISTTLQHLTYPFHR